MTLCDSNVQEAGIGTWFIIVFILCLFAGLPVKPLPKTRKRRE